MSDYTVKQVAKLSGVSVRTLHHYDAIGLLKPDSVGANGYRHYGKAELARLQQILFHRELGFPLEEIRQVLDAPDFDRAAALAAHRAKLEAETKRYRRLVRTIDETLAALQGGAAMDDKAMFRGFDPEKQAEHEDWLLDHHGEGMRERIAQSKAGMKDWKQADFDRAQDEAAAIEAAVAKALAEGLPADSATVQALMTRHHGWVERMWSRTPTGGAFAGLGELYRSHPEFRARYEARAVGLTDYLAEAMRVFAARMPG